MFWFLCMCGLHGLLPTSGDNFMSIAPSEIYFMRKMLFNTYFPRCNLWIQFLLRKRVHPGMYVEVYMTCLSALNTAFIGYASIASCPQCTEQQCYQRSSLWFKKLAGLSINCAQTFSWIHGSDWITAEQPCFWLSSNWSFVSRACLRNGHAQENLCWEELQCISCKYLDNFFFWLCTPAQWIWNETMNKRLKCRQSPLIWGHLHADWVVCVSPTYIPFYR